MVNRVRVLVAVWVGLGCADAAVAQDTTIAVAGARYAGSSFRNWFFGRAHRDLWTVPFRVPLLDLRKTAGGLTPIERGGGEQTRTLHLRGKDGREYLFRSVDKYVGDGLPPELKDTPAENLGQELVASFHPSGALMVPGLLDAAGVLHAVPRLYVMPNDPRLGKFRSTFGGMLGQFELKPQEGPKDTKGFAGSRKIIKLETMQEHLRENSKHRIASADYLAARLIDFLIGDTDRNTDQWRWARFDDGQGGYRWRPIPRDRDWAFINADGVGHRLIRLFNKKLVPFGDELPPLSALTFGSIALDRQFLTDLDRNTWDAVTARVVAALTDSVIDAAGQRLPPKHRAINADVETKLRARVAQLPVRSAEFYAWLTREVDIHATDENDVVEIRRFSDGSVDVALYKAARPAPIISNGDGETIEDDENGPRRAYYHRRFVRPETEEIRVYLNGGADRADIRGDAEHSMVVRVIGGGGDDVLVDSSRVMTGGTHTRLYDHDGDNTIHLGASASADGKAFEAPGKSSSWLQRKMLRQRYRDWGSSSSFGPAIDFQSNSGVLLGAQYRREHFGFRRVPDQSEWKLKLLYAPLHPGFALEFDSHRTMENSAWSWVAQARGSMLDAVHFFGFGNNTPGTPDDHIDLDRATMLLGVNRTIGQSGYAAAGAAAKYTHADATADALQSRPGLEGVGSFTQVGAWWDARIAAGAPGDERFTVALSGALHPELGSVASTYGLWGATTTAHIGRRPTLALRAGAEHAWGSFPFYDAAALGGRRSLRGYSTERYSGDVAVFGNAELRMPVARPTLFVRGELGVFLLGDAGRVFVDGESPGNWHTSAGGGLWFSALTRTVSITYAHGESGKLYIELGLPY